MVFEPDTPWTLHLGENFRFLQSRMPGVLLVPTSSFMSGDFTFGQLCFVDKELVRAIATMNQNSLKLCRDENGHEYFILGHEIKEKQNQAGVTTEKRMYGLYNSDNCSVKHLKEYLEKCDPNAETLFWQINKQAIESPESTPIWYNTKPVIQRQFTSFMGDRCRNAGINTRLLKNFSKFPNK